MGKEEGTITIKEGIKLIKLIKEGIKLIKEGWEKMIMIIKEKWKIKEKWEIFIIIIILLLLFLVILRFTVYNCYKCNINIKDLLDGEQLYESNLFGYFVCIASANFLASIRFGFDVSHHNKSV